MCPADICAIADGDGGDWPGAISVSPIVEFVNEVGAFHGY